MKKYIILLALFTCINVGRAQEGMLRVLTEVERNNLTLEAQRKLTVTNIYGSRTGLAPDDPEIEYIHGWGNPSSLGKTGELTVSQQIDFPTVYRHRAAKAREEAKIYGYEYAAIRQSILLETQLQYYEIIFLRQQGLIYQMQVRNAQRALDIVRVRKNAGDAGILEENKARFELATVVGNYKLNRSELAAAETRLRNLNGGREISIQDQDFATLNELPELHSVIDLFLNESPEILQGIAEVSSSKYDLKLSRDLSLPKLKVGYRYDFTRDEKFNGVVVGMTVPIFANRNNVKRARAQVEYSQAAMERTGVDVRSAVTELFERAVILKELYDEYETISGYDDTGELLVRALESGYISITDFYSQFQPIYEFYLAKITVIKDYLFTEAQLRVLEL